jgi:hypothetical protein
MGKKKLPSMEDSVKVFRTVMERMGITSFNHINRVLIGTVEDNTIFIVPDEALWDNITIDMELHELPVDSDESKYIPYINDSEDWLPVETDLYNGKILTIKFKNFEHQISVNKELLPLKLLKKEFDNIYYKIYYSKNDKVSIILGIKKRYEGVVDGSGFELIRLFFVI